MKITKQIVIEHFFKKYTIFGTLNDTVFVFVRAKQYLFSSVIPCWRAPEIAGQPLVFRAVHTRGALATKRWAQDTHLACYRPSGLFLLVSISELNFSNFYRAALHVEFFAREIRRGRYHIPSCRNNNNNNNDDDNNDVGFGPCFKKTKKSTRNRAAV